MSASSVTAIGPSKLYVTALGLDVALRAHGTASAPCRCAMCGDAIRAGEPVLEVGPSTFGPNFPNVHDLRAPASECVCGYCALLRGRAGCQVMAKSYATADGVFMLASTDQQASFVLDPPEPPFVAVLSTRKQLHVIWRTPVSLSRDRFVVRLDDELMVVRRPLVQSALAAYHEIVRLMVGAVDPLTGKRLTGPPCPGSTKLEGGVGSLRPEVLRWLDATGRADLAEPFQLLGTGEWWALSSARTIASGTQLSAPVPVNRANVMGGL